MIETLGESKVKNMLSSFSCPYNKDIEDFLKNKAITFSDQSLSKTHLVYTSYKGKPVLVGYFALAQKYIIIKKESLSKRLRSRISKFATYDQDLKQFYTSAYLIGQLSKNYSNQYDKLISGDELLKMATDKLSAIQQEIGGKIIYLECEDNEKLIEFYSRNGFVTFGKRTLEKDETELMNGKYLIQMLRYS